MVWEPEVSWAVAVRMSTLGWKKMRSTPMPAMENDSMCSTSLTRVAIRRSNGVITRPVMSSADRPEYCHATAIDGILMSGKISAGVFNAASTPKMRIISAMTMNVKGRESAMRTMPFIRYSSGPQRGGGRAGRSRKAPLLRRI